MKHQRSLEHDPRLAFLRKVNGSIVSDAKGQTKRPPSKRPLTLARVSILEKPDDARQGTESR